MRIIPAIDLMGSKVVRLIQGKEKSRKVYSDNPLQVAKDWVSQGAKFLHLVDLDKAFAKGDNFKTIAKIIEKIDVDVQVGGGIRSLSYAKRLLGAGARRIVVSTKAIEDKYFLKTLLSEFSDLVALGLDIKSGRVALRGWRKSIDLDVTSFVEEQKKYGLKWLIYTDITKDGTLSGLNTRDIKKIKNLTGLNIIASGGVACIADLKKLKKLQIWGVIIGKALYEEKFSLRQAIRGV